MCMWDPDHWGRLSTPPSCDSSINEESLCSMLHGRFTIGIVSPTFVLGFNSISLLKISWHFCTVLKESFAQIFSRAIELIPWYLQQCPYGSGSSSQHPWGLPPLAPQPSPEIGAVPGAVQGCFFSMTSSHFSSGWLFSSHSNMSTHFTQICGPFSLPKTS